MPRVPNLSSVVMRAVCAAVLCLAFAAGAARASTTSSSGVIATVAGHPITVAAFDQAYATAAHGSVPIDPPGFERCAAALERQYTRLSAVVKHKHVKPPPAPSHASLIKQCRERQTALRDGAITQLIEQEWNVLEAQADHITVTPGAVQAAFAAQRRSFGGAAKYQRYLARIGQTLAQAVAQLRLNLVEQKLQQHWLGAPVHVSEQQVAAFFRAHHAEFVLPHQPHPKLSMYAARIRLLLAEQVRARRAAAARTAFDRRWLAQTVCQPGYVVSECAKTG